MMDDATMTLYQGGNILPRLAAAAGGTNVPYAAVATGPLVPFIQGGQMVDLPAVLNTHDQAVQIEGINALFSAAKKTTDICKSYSNVHSLENLSLLQYQQLTIANFTQFNLYGCQGQPMPSVQDAYAQIAKNTCTRGQKAQAGSEQAISWEDTAGAGPDSVVFHYTFFPTVSTSKAARTRLFGKDPVEKISAIVYAVFYSNKQPVSSPEGYGGMPLIGPPTGKWRKYPLQAPYSGVEVNVNNDFIEDNSCELSIMNALNLASPHHNWFVWMMPLYNYNAVHPKYHNKPLPYQYFRVHGPSAGLAFIGAIMGCPSTLTTGFIRDVAQDTVVSTNPDAPLSSIGRSMTLVDTVQGLTGKAMLAIFYNSPLVFPQFGATKTNYGGGAIPQASDDPESHASRILRMVNDNALSHFMKTFYTPSQVERGVAIADFKTPWFMVASVNDYLMMSAYAFIGWMMEFADEKLGIADKWRPQKVGDGLPALFSQASQVEAYDNLDAAVKTARGAQQRMAVAQFDVKRQKQLERGAATKATAAQLKTGNYAPYLAARATAAGKAYDKRAAKSVANVDKRTAAAEKTKQTVLDRSQNRVAFYQSGPKKSAGRKAFVAKAKADSKAKPPKGSKAVRAAYITKFGGKGGGQGLIGLAQKMASGFQHAEQVINMGRAHIARGEAMQAQEALARGNREAQQTAAAAQIAGVDTAPVVQAAAASVVNTLQQAQAEQQQAQADNANAAMGTVANIAPIPRQQQPGYAKTQRRPQEQEPRREQFENSD